MGGRIFKLRVGDHPDRALNSSHPAPFHFAMLQNSSSVITKPIDDVDRIKYLDRPLNQTQRRREATRSGEAIRPPLRRAISAPGHTWPGADKAQRPKKPVIRHVLEQLVLSSEDDSDEDSDDGEEEGKDNEGVQSSRLFGGWQKMGPRMRDRFRRRSKSMGGVPRPKTV